METLLLFNAAGTYVVTGALFALAILRLKLWAGNKRRRIPSYHDKKQNKLYVDISDQQDLEILNEDMESTFQETGKKLTRKRL